MVSGKLDPLWKEKLSMFKASGISVRAWCHKHQIPITTFYGWKQRLNKQSATNHQTIHSPPSQPLKVTQEFIELKDTQPFDSGIVLECAGVKIYLMAKFDPLVLKQCINCLRGVSC